MSLITDEGSCSVTETFELFCVDLASVLILSSWLHLATQAYITLFCLVLYCVFLFSSQHFVAIRAYSHRLGTAEQKKNAEVWILYTLMHECVNTQFAKKGNESVVDCCIKAAQVCAYCMCVWLCYKHNCANTEWLSVTWMLLCSEYVPNNMMHMHGTFLWIHSICIRASVSHNLLICMYIQNFHHISCTITSDIFH